MLSSIKNNLYAAIQRVYNPANPRNTTVQSPADGIEAPRFNNAPLWSAALMGGLAVPTHAGAASVSITAPPVDAATQHAAKINQLVLKLWPDAKTMTLQGERTGVTPFYSNSLTIDGTKYHLKIARSTSDFDVEEFAQEVRHAAWAGERALAPAVVYEDVSKGILVTTFAEDAISDWDEGAQEPKLSAMVHFMAAMNRADTAQTAQQVDVSAVLQQVESQISRGLKSENLTAATRQRFNIVQHNIGLIAQTLQGQSFRPARTHGDFHQNNFLYQPRKSVMVDWGRTSLGDPMQELAYLCYFTDRGISELPSLVSIYGPGPNTSVTRAQAYIAVLHAKLFAEEFLGLEPQRAHSSEEKMDYLWAFLQEDFALYGLASE